MRRHQHIAALWSRRQEFGQRRAFDVTGEQEPAASRFDGHDEARFVVIGPWIDGMRAPCCMQHPHAAERVDRKRLASAHDVDWHPPGCGAAAHLGHSRRRAGKKRFGDDDSPYAKPCEQIGDGVEVIGIGMRDDERVDPRHSLRPQE